MPVTRRQTAITPEAWASLYSLSAMDRRLCTCFEFFVSACLFFESKNLFPVRFHAYYDPVLCLRFIERLVEAADPRLAVIGELTLAVVVVDDQHEALSGACGGILQHLQIAVRVSE